MKIDLYLNKIGFPHLCRMEKPQKLPGPGDKITVNNRYYEVTEVKKDKRAGNIEIYVNPPEDSNPT